MVKADQLSLLVETVSVCLAAILGEGHTLGREIKGSFFDITLPLTCGEKEEKRQAAQEILDMESHNCSCVNVVSRGYTRCPLGMCIMVGLHP